METASLSHHITTQKPRLALNPVAFIAAGHRGAPRCDTGGILRGVVPLKANLYSPVFCRSMKTIDYPISSIVVMMVMELQISSNKFTNRHGAPIPVSSLDTNYTNCLLNLFKLDLDKSQMQLVNFLKTRDSWNSNSNEIVAFTPWTLRKLTFSLPLVWPSRLTHRTWSAWRLRQIDGVPFTWKNNSWWDRWTYAGESGNVWSIR